MIRYFWKYRYFNLLIIFTVFLFCILNISSIKVYFDSERIIELSNVEKNIIENSLDDSNLLLLGLELNKSIDFENIVLIQKIIGRIKKEEKIKSIKSIFTEKKLSNLSPYPFPVKLLNIDNLEEFNNSIKRIDVFKSNFITDDLKSLLFVIKCQDLNSESEKKILLKMLSDSFKEIDAKSLNITGQIKSELYMQKNVIFEVVIFTIFTLLLCVIVLWFFTKNIYVIIINLVSIFLSIFFSFSISNFIYDGIELVMIIVPAVIFIITISDFMHLQNISRMSENKYKFFRMQILQIGKPVFLTSITTAIGFLSFSFTDFEPIKRFGLITTCSIFISLFIIVTMYSLFIDKNLNNQKVENKSINKIISYVLLLRKYKVQLIFMFSVLSFLGLYSVKIDNYLTDEINNKSDLYNEIMFFDKKFGGIKPVSINNNKEITFKNLKLITKKLDSLKINTDFFYNVKDSFFLNARMNDVGSYESNLIYKIIENSLSKTGQNLKISGIGYLFDKISNELTFDILVSLLIAIIIIGIIFVIINNFNYRYFLVSLIPNVLPILTCLGILHFSDFYFSLSNAFIFAIVFGLIVDDSIHIISAYSINRKNQKSIQESLDYCANYTFKAVCKTTLVIIVSLIPLLFSEFKSISQLAMITMISATIAVIFDILFLPLILKKYIK